MKKELFTRVGLSAVLVLTLLLASFSSVQAAVLTDVSDVMSDSGSSELSDHDISFKSTSGIAAGNTITLKFDDVGNAFNFGSVALGDIDMLTGTCGAESQETLDTTPSGATWGVNVNATTDEITITSGTDTVASGDCVVIWIGTNATSGTNQIQNPTAGVYDLDIVTTSDTGLTKLAVFSHVTADVTVDETLTFTVSGQNSGDCVTSADINTTATSISYGSVNANTFSAGCQQLYVATNASGGYSVTVQQDGPLTAPSTDTIDAGTCDGTCSITTAAAWATATNNGFAYHIDDVTGTDGQETTGYRLLGTLGTDTPEIIMSNSGVVSGNEIEVNYKISVSGSQPAGTYDNEIIYVATPTY